MLNVCLCALEDQYNLLLDLVLKLALNIIRC